MQLFIVDSFTHAPFWGNPAGVVLLETGEAFPADAFMQNLAAELKHSETVFIQPLGPASFTLRYFTPKSEVSLCGHATIAAFTVLRKTGRIAAGLYQAHTLTGTLAVTVEEDMIWLEMAEPKLAHIFSPNQWPALYQALALDPLVRPEHLAPGLVNVGLSDILLPVKTPAQLQAAKLNHQAVISLCEMYHAAGVHLFCLSDEAEITAHCRNFAPLYGIDEEAATGTAAVGLTYYLHKQGLLPARSRYTFKQGQALNRPALLYTRLDGECLQLGGQACLIFSGLLYGSPKLS